MFKAPPSTNFDSLIILNVFLFLLSENGIILISFFKLFIEIFLDKILRFEVEGSKLTISKFLYILAA